MKKSLFALLALSLCACGANNEPVAEATPTPVVETTPAPTAAATAESEVDENGLSLLPLDMSEYKWLDTNDLPFKEIGIEESLRLFDEGLTGIIYYGYPGCPYCERAVSIISETAKEMGVQPYYCDVYGPDVVAMGNEGLTNFLNDRFYPVLSDALTMNTDENGNEEPAFMVPNVIAVKDGKILGNHVALVDSFSPQSDSDQMNEEQIAELKAIYTDLFNSIQ